MNHSGSEGYVIRRMARAELDAALKSAAAEGWNPGLSDAEAFWAADGDGFFVGELDGRVAASISAVRYAAKGLSGQAGQASAAFGFIGLYIVRQGLRGRGLGKRLWDAAQASLDEVPTIGLDAVLAQVDTYRKAGFALARISRRYEGTAGGEAPPDLHPLAHTPLAEVLAYDACCFPARREAFLRTWLGLPGHVALGRSKGGRLAGFGVLRPCGVGSKIGPLFADDAETAQSLLRGLCASAEPGPVYFDTPESNPAAVRLAEAHGMRVVFQTGRMYRGPAPEYDLDREFGVTSFELG